MSTRGEDIHMYEGTGDDLAENINGSQRIVIVPDASPIQREPNTTEHVRIMWGQRLIDDLAAGRYRSLVCAVNAKDNTRGIISILADCLPTSQWKEPMITDHARHFAQSGTIRVIKYDMDRIEVLAILRPLESENLTLDHLSAGFRMVSSMLTNRPDRLPVASVCFLGARANRLIDENGKEPRFETVLRLMYDAGFRGDVYPTPRMWQKSPAGVFPRYPFPESFKQMCDGGF